MSVVALSRIQFAAVTMFHFFFVPLTLGLSVLVAYMETRYAATRDERFLRMAKFWGRLFLVNFAIGVVTGITLEFQFGMNWSEYARYVGDIFGAPLAIEATVAFFLESTFIGLWIFGWKRLSPTAHAIVMWVVALASTLSALWILLANGWMQHPVGYEIQDGRAVLTDFMAVVTNPYAWVKFMHTVLSGYVLAAFFVAGISAYHLLKKNDVDLFRSSFHIAAVFGVVCSVLLVYAGDLSGQEVGNQQHSKLAAIEAEWESGPNIPFWVSEWPDPKNERNVAQFLPIPGGMSWIVYRDVNASILGLRDIAPEDRPPILVNFIAFRVMVILGFLFPVMMLVALVLSMRNRLADTRWFLWIMLFSIALPYIATQLGWIVSEIGRQPWIVFGVLRTKDAVSPNLTAGTVLASLIGFIVIYGTLVVADVYLLARYSRKLVTE